jgi:hypothetical protein
MGGVLIWFAMRASNARLSPRTVAQADEVPRSPTPSPELNPKPATTPPASTAVASTAPVNVPGTKSPEPVGQPIPAAVVTTSPAAAPATGNTEAATTQPMTEPASTLAAQLVIVASELAPPPLPKLQGVFYRPDRPAALLDGKTVLVGSTSGEYSVVAISQQGVTVVRAGQTNVLNMPY